MIKKYCQCCGSFNTEQHGKAGKKQTKISLQIITTKLLFNGKSRLQKTSWVNPNAQNSLLKMVLLSQK